MKPDIVFFHESLPDDFHNAMADDKEECDLLIVIGSSLKVKPVALIPTSIPADVPQILINREHLSHMTFDVELLGDCDIIIQELCHRLGEGWSEICVNNKLNELKDYDFEELCNKPVSIKIDGDNKIEFNNGQSTSSEVRNEKNADNYLVPDNSYVFIPPSRYLFAGAELVEEDSTDDGEEVSDSEDDEEYKDETSNNLSDDSLNNNDNLMNSNHKTIVSKQNEKKCSTTSDKPNNQLNSFSPIDTNNNS